MTSKLENNTRAVGPLSRCVIAGPRPTNHCQSKAATLAAGIKLPSCQPLLIVC